MPLIAPSGAKNPFERSERPPIATKIAATRLSQPYHWASTRRLPHAAARIAAVANQNDFRGHEAVDAVDAFHQQGVALRVDSRQRSEERVPDDAERNGDHRRPEEHRRRQPWTGGAEPQCKRRRKGEKERCRNPGQDGPGHHSVVVVLEKPGDLGAGVVRRGRRARQRVPDHGQHDEADSRSRTETA
jgi:hypothetical protein